MPNTKIEALGNVISRGKGVQLNLDIAKLHTRTMIQVPVIVQRAKNEGPRLLITGGIHGNEDNGVEVVRQLISKKYPLLSTRGMPYSTSPGIRALPTVEHCGKPVIFF